MYVTTGVVLHEIWQLRQEEGSHLELLCIKPTGLLVTYFNTLFLFVWLQVINKVKLIHQSEGHIKVKVKYRSGTVNSKSFVGKVLFQIKRKFELNYAL